MLTVIVKGTNGCNLACSYCSLGKKSNFKYISKSALDKLLDFSCGFAKYRGENSINFILHGGEPTLVDPNIYDESITHVKEKYPDIKIIISMQTNGLVLTGNFIQLIKKHDISMGISIDGSADIHNSERKTINGKDSYNSVIANIDKALDENIHVSCLMVLTRNALNKDLSYLKYFEKKNLHLKINPLLNYGETVTHPELVLQNGDYAKYLIRVYEEIIQKKLNVSITPIDKILRGIISGQSIRECTFDTKCSEHFLCIDYKGNVYPCGKFSDMEEMCMGNIFYQSYDGIEVFLKDNLCSRRNEKISSKCLKCRYLKLCNAGCSAEALINGDINGEPILCSDYKILFDYFYTTGLRKFRDVLIQSKRTLEEQK